MQMPLFSVADVGIKPPAALHKFARKYDPISRC
jgi:hypothetical protein